MIQPKGEEEKVFLVRKGVDMVIPVMAVHRDSQFYPEPERFDPGRFSDENKSKVIPGTYLPFGWGPRNCIGKIYALFIETANRCGCRVEVCASRNQNSVLSFALEV